MSSIKQQKRKIEEICNDNDSLDTWDAFLALHTPSSVSKKKKVEMFSLSITYPHSDDEDADPLFVIPENRSPDVSDEEQEHLQELHDAGLCDDCIREMHEEYHAKRKEKKRFADWKDGHGRSREDWVSILRKK